MGARLFGHKRASPVVFGHKKVARKSRCRPTNQDNRCEKEKSDVRGSGRRPQSPEMHSSRMYSRGVKRSSLGRFFFALFIDYAVFAKTKKKRALSAVGAELPGASLEKKNAASLGKKKRCRRGASWRKCTRRRCGTWAGPRSSRTRTSSPRPCTSRPSSSTGCPPLPRDFRRARFQAKCTHAALHAEELGVDWRCEEKENRRKQLKRKVEELESSWRSKCASAASEAKVLRRKLSQAQEHIAVLETASPVDRKSAPLFFCSFCQNHVSGYSKTGSVCARDVGMRAAILGPEPI